ncbi:MAG: T9SS type A sorting domain-containing protein [Candidatus Marinimicrobia bacterium]|nr:T9SS type A sorting domain-containing protein [Candidatus Neomarinimicrobiota bacterium]
MLRLIIFLLLAVGGYSASATGNDSQAANLRSLENSLWDRNQVQNWMMNTGRLVSHIQTGRSGMTWPGEMDQSVIFASGPWIIGRVNGEIRSAVAEYGSEFVPGPIGSDSNEPEYRFYSIAAEDDNSSEDWQNWPVDQGAPWIDNDGNNEYDPSIDEPDVRGDLFYWYVMGDHDVNAHSTQFSTLPLGVEVRSSFFGFDTIAPLGNTIFFKWDIVNVSENDLEDVYIGIWSDPDLGDATDDFVGCDTILGMGYCYNGNEFDNSFATQIPAVGYLLLEGEEPSGMSSFVMGANGSPSFGDPGNAEEAYNYVSGLTMQGDPWFDPNGNPTSFLYPGDPLTGDGWNMSDDQTPDDLRLLVNSGPFALAPGESQVLMGAILISDGGNYLNSVSRLKDEAAIIKEIWESDFDILTPPIIVNEIDFPHNTESVGPFTIQYEMVDVWGDWSDYRIFNYELEGGSGGQFIEFINTSGNLWEVTLPAFDVSETAILNYNLGIRSADGSEFYYPGDQNGRQFIFGPDLTGPHIGELIQLQDIHHKLGIEKQIYIDDTFDQRTDIAEVALNWQVGDGAIQSTVMDLVDSVQLYMDWHYSYHALMDIEPLAGADSIYFWISATDASLNGSLATTPVNWFMAGDQEYIGDWEHSSSYSSIMDWEGFDNGALLPFNAPGAPWGRVIQETITSSGAETDTMRYTRSLDLSAFEHAWLSIPMATQIPDTSSYVSVEVFMDSEWQSLVQLTGVVMPDTQRFNIGGFSGQDDFSLRFLVHRAGGPINWYIDDVLLHSWLPVDVDKHQVLPTAFLLEPNYPNPFNPTTAISYAIPEPSSIKLTVFDIRGQEVTILSESDKPPGNYEVQWNGLDHSGNQVSTGVYFCRLQVVDPATGRAGDHTQTIKMVLLR